MSNLKSGTPVYLPYRGQFAVVSVVNPPSDTRRLLVVTADGRRHGVWEQEVQLVHSRECDCHECSLTRSRNHNPTTCDCQLHEAARRRV